MECEICGSRPLKDNKVILTRVNEYGAKGIWRCEKCLTPEQKVAQDPDTHELCKIITGASSSSNAIEMSRAVKGQNK